MVFFGGEDNQNVIIYFNSLMWWTQVYSNFYISGPSMVSGKSWLEKWFYYIY